MSRETRPQSTINHASNADCVDQRSGVIALAISFVIVALVWCVVLPWWAAQPDMKEHLQFLEDQGIDPSAMFYTELDAMDEILKKIESGG